MYYWNYGDGISNNVLIIYYMYIYSILGIYFLNVICLNVLSFKLNYIMIKIEIKINNFVLVFFFVIILEVMLFIFGMIIGFDYICVWKKNGVFFVIIMVIIIFLNGNFDYIFLEDGIYEIFVICVNNINSESSFIILIV